MTAAKKVLTLHLKYEPEVASKTLAKARPRKSGRQVMHGVWTLLRGNETPFVLCTAGPTGGPRAKPVGMLAFSVLFHMSSVVGGGRVHVWWGVTWRAAGYELGRNGPSISAPRRPICPAPPPAGSFQ